MSTFGRKRWRDLRRNRAQTLAVVAAITAGLALFGAAYDAFRSLVASYERLYERVELADLWVIGGDVDAFAAQAADEPGVEAVATRTEIDVGMRFGTRELLGRVITVPSGHQPAVNQLLILEGRHPGTDGAPAGGVVLEQHAASHFELGPGDTFEVREPGSWRQVEVVGVAASAEYVWPARSRHEILTSPEDFAVAFFPPERVQGLAAPPVRQAVVAYAEGADAASVTDRLDRLAEQHGAVDVYDRAAQASNAALQSDVQGLGDLAFLFPVLFLTGAGLGAWIVLTRLVISQQGLIGTLVASGVPRRRVLTHYVGYGVILGAVGGVLGAAVGAGLAALLADAYTSAIDVPITVVAVDGTTQLIGLGLGIGTGVVAAAPPAIRALRMEPARAMQGSVPTGVAGGRSVVERLVPRSDRLSVSARLVLRAARRNPRRTATTVLGIVLACTMIMATGGMVDTVQVLLDRQFTEIQRDDAQVVLEGSPTEERLARLRSVEGVAEVEPALVTPVGLEHDGQRHGTAVVALPAATRLHRFPGLEGGLPPDGLVVGESARRVLDLEEGDEVTVRVPTTDEAVTDQVVAFVSEPLSSVAYASLEHVRSVAQALDPAARSAQDAGLPGYALVRYEDGADRAEVEQRIADVDDVIAVTDTQALLETVNDFLGLFWAMIGTMLVFAGLLAFALVFNAMSVNIAERTGELATLKAAGVSQRAVARLVTAENLLVTALSLVPGLVVGYYAADFFMSQFETEQFSFPLVMRWTTPALTAAAILVVAVVSQWPGLRAVNRLDVSRVVRERSI